MATYIPLFDEYVLIEATKIRLHFFFLLGLSVLVTIIQFHYLCPDLDFFTSFLFVSLPMFALEVEVIYSSSEIIRSSLRNRFLSNSSTSSRVLFCVLVPERIKNKKISLKRNPKIRPHRTPPKNLKNDNNNIFNGFQSVTD